MGDDFPEEAKADKEITGNINASRREEVFLDG